MTIKTFCFDMDGVICNLDHDDYEHRTPIQDTLDLMDDLYYEGHTIIINTGRHILHMPNTKDWLEKNKVSYNHIQFGKPVADVYIDDKGLRFNGYFLKEKIEKLINEGEL